MKKYICVVAAAFLLMLPIRMFAGDYDKAWQALLKNEKKEAIALFHKAFKSKDHADNALAMLVCLESYEGIDYLEKYGKSPIREMQNPAPYTYGLWFYEAFFGQHGKKKGIQLEALQSLQNDDRFNGSMKAAGNYFLGFHYAVSYQIEQNKKSFKNMGAIEDWEFVGPFDNVSGSGFYKEYPPISTPVSKEGFISSNNNLVNWFVPTINTGQGWVMVAPFVTPTTAVGYAQTFIQSEMEQDVLINLGGNCAFKLWLNDKLLFADPEARVTELDAYMMKAHLKKGYNRVLVQFGFTSTVSSPNFIVRLTDTDFKAIPGLEVTPAYHEYQVDKSTAKVELLPGFAEKYFLEKIKNDPDDPANALLLSKVYLRNHFYDKAKEVVAPIYTEYPKSAFIVNEYAKCLNAEYESTQINELVEQVKLLDPENFYVLSNELDRLQKEQRYDEAMAIVNKLEAITGPTMITELRKAGIMAYQGKIDSVITIAKEVYKKEKDRFEIVNMMAILYQKLLSDPVNYRKVMEEFLQDNFNLPIVDALAKDYFDKNEEDKGIATLNKYITVAPYAPASYNDLIRHFFNTQQYDSAIHYLQITQGISPYSSVISSDIANCYVQKNDKKKALDYFKKALTYNPIDYECRSRIRELENKPNILNYFPTADPYKKIEEDNKKVFDSSYASYFIYKGKDVVLYNEGGCEEVIQVIVRINNKNGVDNWKELSIPYNTYYQDVQILKSEVVKPSGSRVPAESSGNEIVFTKIEPGDAIYYTYKIKHYGSGRIGKEFWDKYYFNSFIPVKEVHYNMLVANGKKLQFNFFNEPALKPKRKKIEDFEYYSWDMYNLEPVKDEYYMPDLADVGKVLHVSTVGSWGDIAEWYSDITKMQSRDDYELSAAYDKIFPKGVKGLKELDIARKIYNYIEENIAYSSVSFRQSAYVPQRASTTLQTKLGDCKDVSTLFLALARKAGLDANLVLINTRDNGLNTIQLPSMDFNHCIIRYKAGGTEHYLELTDNYLPFNAKNSSMSQAQILNIPYTYKPGGTIEHLDTEKKEKLALVRMIDIKVEDNDIIVNTESKANGTFASGRRARYYHHTDDEVKNELQSLLSGAFKNQYSIQDYSFKNLDNLADTVSMKLQFKVKNEIINVGDFSMIKPNFIDVPVSINIFKDEERQYPFEYCWYESSDIYKTVVNIELPEGKTFQQVPSGFSGQFKNMTYKLVYQKLSDNKLRIEREFYTDCSQQLPASSVKEMEDFFNQIITAEKKYISFQ